MGLDVEGVLDLFAVAHLVHLQDEVPADARERRLGGRAVRFFHAAFRDVGRLEGHRKQRPSGLFEERWRSSL